MQPGSAEGWGASFPENAPSGSQYTCPYAALLLRGNNSVSVLRQILGLLQKGPTTMPGLATSTLLHGSDWVHQNHIFNRKIHNPSFWSQVQHHSTAILIGSKGAPLILRMCDNHFKQKGIQTQRWRTFLVSLHVSDKLSQNTMWGFPAAKVSQSLPSHFKEDLRCCLPHFLLALPRVY